MVWKNPQRCQNTAACSANVMNWCYTIAAQPLVSSYEVAHRETWPWKWRQSFTPYRRDKWKWNLDQHWGVGHNKGCYHLPLWKELKPVDSCCKERQKVFCPCPQEMSCSIDRAVKRNPVVCTCLKQDITFLFASHYLLCDIVKYSPL